MENVDLSVLIVNYNTCEFLLNCLDSLEKADKDKLKLEIIVIDNGSTDTSVEEVKKRFKKVKILLNKENLGFAKANNLGIKASRGKNILLLNSDTIVLPETLVSMYRYMNTDPKIGVATCRVELPDGELDLACHRGFPTPWAAFTYFVGLEKLFPKSFLFSQYHLGYLSLDKLHEIGSPTGAFYLVKRKVIEEVGLLDEDYFMYAEDLDWSYRIKKAGWKIMYYPYTKIIHFKKQSGRENKNKDERKKATVYFYETMKIFYKKHYFNKYPQFLTKLVMLMIDLKKNLSLIFS